ncbi:MAG TPA: hypothetical protein ENK52_05725 [Saprospiraceae bacterium]|nr:hypothetical protein [Saprospiraceae bacterium]
MKKYLVLLLTLAMVFSCKDDENPEPEIYNGFATAKINSEEYNFKPHMAFFSSVNSYGLSLQYHINENILRKAITFSFINGEIGKKIAYPLRFNNQDTLQCSYGTSIVDGDVFGNYYWLNENDEIEDYLELLEFNESTGEVIGKFQASFYIDTFAIFDQNSPDTIIITDGYFETIIFD